MKTKIQALQLRNKQQRIKRKLTKKKMALVSWECMKEQGFNKATGEDNCVFFQEKEELRLLGAL